VAFGAGTLIVTAAAEQSDPMAAMQHTNQQGFAAAGMNMKAMSPDPIPDGSRRIRVDLEVRATSGEVRFPADVFTMVNGDGSCEPVKPHSSFLGDATAPQGLVSTGNLQFDVPGTWTTPRLVVAGAASPVVLTGMTPARVDDHTGHTQPPSAAPDEHVDHGDHDAHSLGGDRPTP